MIKITETHVTIMVKDMDVAIAFYQNIGLTIKNRWGNHYAIVEATGITIGIHPAREDGKGSGNTSIGFMIENADAAKALLEKNNVSFKRFDDEKSGIYLNFKDPDGTNLYFSQPNWK